ncbi:hypothetical protein LMG28688_01579 [Paraburkholderia caffeinitolerans]|uniref:Uncharacterized protein n=1 Tax=Paraburkholderia caffeinitolerans TaxID=1723730 RepID=A0A6J5FQ57_9BURK|nr:hypothetical protein [Paraburkholderia caffeinitolerans]CAB3783101.1 hypothetical protein LMG28688_01579 [Paraburkholderia caffeinitolerans]
MSDAGHPNMFPVAGESAVIAVDLNGNPNAAPEQATAAAAKADPWANPATRLQRASDSNDTTQTPAATGAKERRPTRADQVIELLTNNGPMTAAKLREALGINVGGGITPYIDSALKNGSIIRDGQLYMLPDAVRRTCADAELESRPSEPQAQASVAPRAPMSAPVESLRAAPLQRKPDFALATEEAMLTVWPDGRVTVRSDGVFIELTPHQLKPIRISIDTRI